MRLLNDADDPLVLEIEAWLAESRRFRAFADQHQDKIRKKLRGATAPEARRDVRAELRVAHLLLADRRIQLAFEAYGSGRGGPDFTAAFRDQRTFNVEVTRLRGEPNPAAFAGTLMPKLLQLPPSVPNAVVMAITDRDADALDVDAAVRSVRDRADRKDEAYFVTRGFQGSRGFYDRFLRLGAVLVWSENAAGSARAALWTNRSARIAPPEQAMRACLLALRAE